MNDLISRLSQAVATSRSKNHVRLKHETVAEIIDTLEVTLPAASQPEAEPVAWTGSGSLMALSVGREGFIWPTKADSHPIPLYANPTPAPVVPAEGLDALVTQLQGIAEKRYDMGRRTLTIADADVISRAIRALRAQQPAAPVSGVTVRRKPTMTVDRNALAALIKAVEGGTFLMDVLSDGRTERIAHEAFSGSLDAAKTLHEALLPGWEWDLDSDGEAEVWPLDDRAGNWPVRGVSRGHPERAWLIAILRAVEAGR